MAKKTAISVTVVSNKKGVGSKVANKAMKMAKAKMSGSKKSSSKGKC